MYYLIWIVSAFVAVGLGVYVATQLDKKESKYKVKK